MEQLLILAFGALILLPLPLCLYLIRRAKRLEQRIDALESQLRQGEAGPLSEAAAPVGDALAPPPEPATARLVVDEGLELPLTAEPSASRTSVSETPSVTANQPPPLPPQRISTQAAVALRSLGLWPPEDLARRESGLIQWWFPRVGGLLAVLTVIFFAAYVSSGSPPWVKWVWLVAVDLGVAGLGLRFYRKAEQRRFGSTLVSVGLAMFYVSVVAGYTADPVRVFQNPLLGVAAQLACVALIFATSLWLRDRHIGILASAFGYASTFFSAYAGWNEGALLSAFALQLAGMAVGYRLKAPPLVSLASIGVYTPLLAFCVFRGLGSQHYTLPHSYSVLAFLGLAVSALPIASLGGRLAQRYSPTGWRFLQGANTTLSLALGYAYFRYFTQDLTLFYGVLCLLFLVWALVFLRIGIRSFLFQLLFIKAAGLAALWAANYFEGDLRWFALLVDALVVAFVARLSTSRWKEVASLVLWLVAALLALDALPAAELDPWSSRWLLYALLPLLGTLGPARLYKAMPSTPARSLVYGLVALANGALATLVVFRSALPINADPTYLATLAALLAAIGLIPGFSLRVAAGAGCLPLLAGHVDYWTDPFGLGPLLALLAVSLAAALGCAHALTKSLRRGLLLFEWILLALSMVSVVAFLESTFGSAPWLPFVFPALSIAVFAAGSRPFRALADVAFIPLAFQTLNVQYERIGLPAAAGILALYGLLLAWPRLAPAAARHPHLFRRRAAWRPLHHMLVAALALSLASRFEHWFPAALLLTFSGYGLFALWRLHRHRSALLAGLALLAAALALTAFASLFAENFTAQSAPWSSQVLLIGALQSFGFLGCALWLAKTRSRRLGPSARSTILYGLALGSFSASALSLSYPELQLSAYYTPLVALYCLVLVSLGIAFRIKPFRIVAVAGFLLPVGRLFLYDVQETLYRIIAFAALAILLTFIGYLYSRFASRIE